MGPLEDPLAVTDHEGKVHGLESLRIVDASIMPSGRLQSIILFLLSISFYNSSEKMFFLPPSVVSGNLNGPVVMMAEKLADAIKGVAPLPHSDAPVWKPETLMTAQRGI